jgi:hypothetical protein
MQNNDNLLIYDDNNDRTISSFNDNSVSYEEEDEKKSNKIELIKRVTGFQNYNKNGAMEIEYNENKLESLNELDEEKLEIDILDKAYEIPMNVSKYPYNYSNEIIFEEDDINDINIETLTLNKKKFGIRKSPMIETFLVNLFVFSEFKDPSKIEKDNRVKVYFVKKDVKQDKYIIDSKEILKKLKLNDNNNKDLINFFEGINKFFEDKKFLNMKSSNSKFKFRVYSIIFITLILIFSSLIALSYFFIKKNQLPKYYNYIIIILIILCILLFISQFEKFKHMELYLLYNKLNYFLNIYSLIISYVEEYNNKVFLQIKIRVTVPVSFNYIMFNTEPEKDIEIKHLNMIFLKRKFYPDIKKVKKDKNLINKFNEITGSLSISGGINSISYNPTVHI